MFVADGEIGVVDWYNVGLFKMVLTNINEEVKSFS